MENLGDSDLTFDAVSWEVFNFLDFMVRQIEVHEYQHYGRNHTTCLVIFPRGSKIRYWFELLGIELTKYILPPLHVQVGHLLPVKVISGFLG